MDPGHALVRGLKLGVSNLELAAVTWAAGLATGLLIVFPVVGLALGAAASLVPAVQDASGLEGFLLATDLMLQHWAVVLGAVLLATAWIGLVLFFYLYLQAGVTGCVVKAHRTAPPTDRSLRPRLGASQAFKAFSLDLLWEQSRAHGWRVTMVATAYSVAGTLVLSLYGLWVLGCVRLGMKGSPQLVGAIVGGIVGLFPVVLVLVVLSAHYRLSVVCAVQRACGWREAIVAANAVLRARFLPFLAVMGGAIAAQYILAMAFLLISLPFLALSLLPLVGLLAVIPRLLLTLVQSLLSSVLAVAFTGAVAAVCEPLGEKGAGETGNQRAGEKTEDQGRIELGNA
jgi:hypothetical protein